MVAPDISTRTSDHKPKSRPSIGTKGRSFKKKSSPILRLTLLAAVAWVAVFLYTHRIFFKHAVHEHIEQKKYLHPAQQFLHEGKNLRQNVAQIRRATVKQQATSACEKAIHKADRAQCVADTLQLFHIDDKLAYHFIQLLKSSKEKDLRGSEAEHPCMRIGMASHRANCYQNIVATNDLTVAKKFAELLKEAAEGDGVTVHDAKIACALAREKDLCLHDVLGTSDLDVADIYEKVPAPKKNELGKYLLQYHHHKFTEKDAIQSCKMVHPEDREECQKHVLKLDDEETAEHYIHLLQDQEHHEEDAKAMTQEEAKSLCQSLKQNHFQAQCLEDIGSLPNRHMADHFLELYDEPQASSMVSQMDGEKLCHHLRLTHHKHKYESCVKSLTQMKGIQAASHYSKLLRLHQNEEDQPKEDPADREIITAAKATTICQKVQPKQQQEECQKDVQTMNDWDTAEKYAKLLLPPEEATKKEPELGAGFDNSSVNAFKEEAAAACGKTMNKKGATACEKGLKRTYQMDPRAAKHFVKLLNDNDFKDLKVADAEHPCEIISLAWYRSACYQDILATNSLQVAKKMAELLKAQADNNKVTEHDAKVACALAQQKANCIYDVLAIQDLESAETYDQLPTPPKDKFGKFLLQANHHQFSEKDAIQACGKAEPKDQKKCQDQLLKLDEEETAEHYIHLLLDQEHHKENAHVMTQDEAKSLCNSVKIFHQPQCLADITSLPNRHVADHYIQLFGDEQASSPVSQLDAEKLCQHVRLSHPSRQLFESCVKSLTQMKGIQAASHYSKLLQLHKKVEQFEEDSVDKVLITGAKATSICAKVQPWQKQKECQKDVQTMNDWDTADKYAQLLSPATSGGLSGMGSNDLKKDAEEACKKSIHPDDVPECIEGLLNLNTMKSQVAKHYIGLLNTSGEKNLEGSEAEHPCMKLTADTHRATCYQNVLATSTLGVAKKMAQFIKADEEHKPSVTLHDATIACALAREKGTCIHDVLGTGDLEAAEMYDNHAAPAKGAKGKVALGAHHHHMTEKEAEQACRLVHPEDKEKCQKHVLTMDDEQTATHYIHLLQDAEHHLDTTTAISDSQATTLCAAVKHTKHHQQCLHDIHLLPNEHIAEHLILLYDDQHASQKVSLQESQQLCNHLKLSQKQKNHAACVKYLTGVTGIEAAAHCSKLLRQIHELEADKPQVKTLLTKSQADSICGDLRPSQLQEECRRDVLTLNDLVIARSYAHHFFRGHEEKQEEDSGAAGDREAVKKQAEKACKKAIHPDDVPECIRGLRKLHLMNAEVAQHFMKLLMATKAENLDGAEADHPCLAIDVEMQRSACYQDVLATNDLAVAKEMAQLMQKKFENDSTGRMTLHDATIACALAIEKALCIHDVLGTKDIETADAYEKHAVPSKNEKGKFNIHPQHHKISKKDAEKACRLVHPEDKKKCEDHVLKMDDGETAEHYIHLLQDIEHHSESDSAMGMEEAKSLCTSIKNSQHQKQCVQHVSMLPNKHIASHIIPLYDEEHSSKVVSDKEAEKLCNHLRLSKKQSDHNSCIKYLTQTKGIEAAAHCSKLLQQTQVSKPAAATNKAKTLLTKKQADAACQKVKDEKLREECKKGAQTLNDWDVAQRFAELLDPQAAEVGQQEDKGGVSEQKTDSGNKDAENEMSAKRNAVKKQAETACQKTIHKDFVPDCIEEVMKLDIMNQEVARHYIRLLMASSANHLEAAEAEHPCMKINSQEHRATCYQDVLAANDLTVARKMANLMNNNDNVAAEAVTLHDAQIACALAIEKGVCIHDVMGTGDLDAADMYPKHKAPKEGAKGDIKLQSHHHKLSKEEAEQACRMIHPEDKKECEARVMNMDDEETAKHYIHLLQDSEHHSNIATTISETEAKELCASVKKSKHYQQCLDEVQLLPNKHVAEHLILLYDDKHATELVSKQNAEKLCNHFKLKDKDHTHNSCMRYLTKSKGIEAASHSSKLLRMVQEKTEAVKMGKKQDQPLLTEKQADSVCRQVKPGKAQDDCKKDVRNLTDLDVAKRYVQLLAKA